MLEINEAVKRFNQKGIGPISLKINSNKIVALIGPSGSGKTTLLKMITNIIKPTSGSINFKYKRKYITYITQGGSLFEHLTIKENLLLTAVKTDAEIITGLNHVNLDESYLLKYPFELSGGECQRIDLVRALLSESKLIILDETFSALDSRNKEEIFAKLVELKTEYKLTIIIITHDLLDALYISDQIIYLNNGKLIYSGDSQGFLDLTSETLKPIITKRQLEIIKQGVK